MNKFDKQHQLNVRKYQRRIDAIYKKAAEEAAARAASLPVPDDYIFTFDDFPAVKKQIDALMATMAADMELTVTDGIRAEWDLSNAKNDALVDSVLGEAASLARYHRTHTDALNAFLERKQNGLGLSDNVWRYTNQFKNEIEMGLDIGIREGKDAASIARSIQQYLQYPDMLFRRVKDEHGVFQLSQRAAAFHPGQGVYRSSYKNALRLAATETNIAYRTADHERWQDLDFIVGIEVHLSNNHTILNHKKERVALFDICDELQGRYPKEFKFVGWHPNCRCIAITITKTKEEVKADLERIRNGEQPSEPMTSENYVKDMPEGFTKWMEDNAERLESAKSMPYFIQDNFKDGDPSQGLRWMVEKPLIPAEDRPLTALEVAEQRHAARTPEREAEILNEWYMRQAMNLVDDMRNGLLPDVTDNINEIFNSIALDDWADARRRISLLQAASRRHAERTAEQVAAIRRMWEERTILPVTQWSATSTKAELGAIADAAAKQSVDYLDVKLLDKKLTSEEIIEKLAGGDLTKGSCSSLAFSYCGNRAGLDVTDFRGGASCSFFSRTANIKEIVSKAGGTVVSNASDFTNAKQLLAKVEVGKEYYFTCGQHAAMVRKTNQGFEFLELQSSRQNGWKKLDDNILRYRFGAKRSHSTYGHKYNGTDCIIEVEKLAEDREFKKLLGYINTNAAKQMKGVKGSIK